MSLFIHVAASGAATARGRVVAALAGVAAAALAVPLLARQHFPASLLLLFLIIPAAQIALTPVWRRAGIYRYLSPTLFVVSRDAGRIEIHGGTAYDYLLCMRWADRGVRAQRILVQHYLDGLIGLAAEIESGRIAQDARITGTSYFFSDGTARRLGFDVRRAPRADVLHAVLDIVSLTVLYSYVRGRPAMPRVWRLREATIVASELARRKRAMQALRARIARSVGPPPPPPVPGEPAVSVAARARATSGADRAPR